MNNKKEKEVEFELNDDGSQAQIVFEESEISNKEIAVDGVENDVRVDENGKAIIIKKRRVPSKLGNSLKTYFSKPANTIIVIFAVILSIMVLAPLIYLLFNTLYISQSQHAYGRVGTLSFSHWAEILAQSENKWALTTFWRPLGNSLLMAILACVVAVGVGGVIAYLVTRTNLPGKKFFSAVFIFPYIMPSWSIAMFWQNMFASSAVGARIPGVIQNLTGILPPEWMSAGLLPCAICLGIHYAPFAYILIGGVLRNMDANLEEAATILKASRLKILLRITLPIVLPSLLSTVLLVFASSLSSYTVPFMIGGNNFLTIAERMRYLVETPQFSGQGYVVSVILMVFSIAILLINQSMTGKRKSYTTVTGKSSQVSLVNLRWGKWVAAVLISLYVVFFCILPMFTFALESFAVTPGNYTDLTLYYWATKENTNPYIHNSFGIMRNPVIWKAFGTSLGVSLVVAFFAGTAGLLVGYGVARNRKSKLASYVSMISFLPYLIPAMSFSAIYFAVSVTPAFSFLYKSIPLVMLVGAVKFMPFATRSGTSSFLQVSHEIEEAATIVKTSWPKRMVRILFPIQKASFISGYMLPFISCMRELTLFVMLAKSDSLLTGVLSTYKTRDAVQMSNGINLIIIATVLLFNFLVNKITGASIDKGVGGN